MAKTPTILLAPIANHTFNVTLPRLPRKRILDKYFDRDGQLERKGIWVRWRKEQITNHDGKDAAPSNGFFEAKIRQGGDFVNSQLVEVTGRDAVDNLIEQAAVGHSVYDLRFELGFMVDRESWSVKTLDGKQDQDDAAYDLRFELGFMVDRESWSVKTLDGKQDQDDAATMALVLDTMNTSVQGPNGDHPKYMPCHQVGELEFEKTITTGLSDKNDPAEIRYVELEAKLHADRAEQCHILSEQLKTFMAVRPEICKGEGVPLGKLTAHIAQQEERAASAWKANEPNRIANMAEVKYERLYGGK